MHHDRRAYRGVHVVVQYDERNIEAQLRTRMMHEWAITVEALSGRLATDLKGGSGPAPVLALLEAISQAMALEEAGARVGTDLQGTIESLRAEAVPFLGRSSAMNEPIQHFLLVFDHEQGHLIDTKEFGSDGDAALAAYATKEREYRDRDRIEIVLVGSDSLETVRFTHANYFDGSVTVSKYLAGI